MSKIEWSQSFPSTDEYTGGSLYGETFDCEGAVALTKYGEFCFELSEEGELYAKFSDSGLTCVYGTGGSLDIFSLDLRSYLGSFTKDEKAKMPKGGKDIDNVVSWFEKTGKHSALSVIVKSGVVEVVTYGEEKDDFLRVKSSEFDLRTGLEGGAKVGDICLPFRVELVGDEFVIGMGESIGDNTVLDVVVVSSNVDFFDDVLSGNPRDIQKLARKILLN